jgi:hypothetical protein
VFLLPQPHADDRNLKTENPGQSFLYNTSERLQKQGALQNIKILRSYLFSHLNSILSHSVYQLEDSLADKFVPVNEHYCNESLQK